MTHTPLLKAIKALVISHGCLTVIDHENMHKNHIFMFCDMSNHITGVVLLYGPTLDSAWPIAFESAQLKGTKLNYLVHEKGLLIIIHTLKKWCINLLGILFIVYTEHHMLENFSIQKHLSQH